DPMNDGRAPFFYESVGGYHAAKLAVYQDYIDEILFAEGAELNPNALDLMGTRFIVAQGLVPGFEPVYQSQETGLLVLENDDFLPRAYFVDSLEVVEGREDMFARIRDTSLVLRETALVGALPEGYEPAPRDTNSVVTVELERFTPREIVWDVETEQDRLLVASEVYYPAGWEAYIDDRRVEIIRVNHLLRGVMIPAGRHNVSMSFEPQSHRTGLRISWIASLLVYAGTVFLGGLLWFQKGHKQGS
ncbi:MAG: YfhO family protein, partial [Rubricoccaceae bacterium]|nr:YfhO family protein [Rubricoccaceae bacterium]